MRFGENGEVDAGYTYIRVYYVCYERACKGFQNTLDERRIAAPWEGRTMLFIVMYEKGIFRGKPCLVPCALWLNRSCVR